jgi:hypothetical protein
MFSLFQTSKARESTAILRRLCEMTADLNAGHTLNERSSTRYSRKIPVLIAPFRADLEAPQTAKIAHTALATDISDDGVGLVCRYPPAEAEIIVGFLLALHKGEHVEFFQGHVQHTEPIGGGFYQVGVLLTARLFAHEHPLVSALTRVALAMLPDSAGH